LRGYGKHYGTPRRDRNAKNLRGDHPRKKEIQEQEKRACRVAEVVRVMWWKRLLIILFALLYFPVGVILALARNYSK
jgi:hypothetical protein